MVDVPAEYFLWAGYLFAFIHFKSFKSEKQIGWGDSWWEFVIPVMGRHRQADPSLRLTGQLD